MNRNVEFLYLYTISICVTGGFTLTFDGPFEKADLVFSHFLIQCCMVHAQECCSVLLITVESFQHLDEYGPLQRIYEVFQVDVFLHVEIIDKKIKKNLIKHLLLYRCMKREALRIVFEELEDLLG